MRSNTDTCLLCRLNPATKTNSHILPRFISTAFLGKKGQPRKGFDLSASTYKAGKTKIVQDSPKENYILCEECETYFSILEKHSALTFNRWREKVQSQEFTETTLSEDLSVITCTSSDPIVLRLFVYSLFWRASISSLDLFSGYQLSSGLEESLRLGLLSVKSLTEKELFLKLAAANIPLHPHAIVSSKTFKAGTANILAAINPGNPAILHVDQFCFLLFEKAADVSSPPLSDYSNFNRGDRMLMILSEALWQELMVEQPIALMAAQVNAQNEPS